MFFFKPDSFDTKCKESGKITGKLAIKENVGGIGCANKPEDVRIIQELINWLIDKGVLLGFIRSSTDGLVNDDLLKKTHKFLLNLDLTKETNYKNIVIIPNSLAFETLQSLAKSDVEKEPLDVISQNLDKKLSLIFTKNGEGVVRGAGDIKERLKNDFGDNHFSLGKGKLHTIHIYGNTTGTVPIEIYLPAVFSLPVYVGGKENVLFAIHKRTKEVISIAHLNTCSNQELLNTYRKLVINAQGSIYIGDIAGYGGPYGYLHTHITLFKNMNSMNLAKGKKYSKGMQDYDNNYDQWLGDFRNL